MFSIFTNVMSRDTHSGPGLPVYKPATQGLKTFENYPSPPSVLIDEAI